MKVLILSGGVGFGGRGKALLSLCDHLSKEFQIEVFSDRLNKTEEDGITFSHLTSHHSINPDVSWNFREWDSEDVGDVSSYDVVIGFDSQTNNLLSSIDCPTVAYCRRGVSNWADEYWTPSKMAADRHNAWLRERGLGDNCYPIYPIWYIERQKSVKPFDEREYDVLIHRRKAEGIGKKLSDFSVHYASDYDWEELSEVYEDSKVFLFPNKRRFEPLGLMPIEAASFGCHLSLPRNAGVSEIFPYHVYRKPEEAIEDILQRGQASDLDVPESPVDPIDRIYQLTKRTVSV